MYAKSFIALDGNGRLTDARTAQTAPYDRYTCHLCNVHWRYHPEYQTERPCFEHRHDTLTENGRQHCPYVKPDRKEVRLIRQLQCYVPDASPMVFQADWHCYICGNDYHGERYCLTCRTGEDSQVSPDEAGSTQEITVYAC